MQGLDWEGEHKADDSHNVQGKNKKIRKRNRPQGISVRCKERMVTLSWNKPDGRGSTVDEYLVQLLHIGPRFRKVKEKTEDHPIGETTETRECGMFKWTSTAAKSHHYIYANPKEAKGSGITSLFFNGDEEGKNLGEWEEVDEDEEKNIYEGKLKGITERTRALNSTASPRTNRHSTNKLPPIRGGGV